jgi:hypothetical protein
MSPMDSFVGIYTATMVSPTYASGHHKRIDGRSAADHLAAITRYPQCGRRPAITATRRGDKGDSVSPCSVSVKIPYSMRTNGPACLPIA